MTKQDKASEPRKLLTVREFAEQLGCSDSSVNRMLKLGTVRKVKIGGMVRIPASEVDRLIEEASK